MAYMQLFVTLAVFLTLDGALANEKPKCAHHNVTFCKLLSSIRKQNEGIENDLEGDDSMLIIIEEIVAANEAVQKALNTTDMEEAQRELRNALDLEYNVLSELKMHCNGGRDCRILGGIYAALVDLVKAILATVEGEDKAAVERAYKTFTNGKNLHLSSRISMLNVRLLSIAAYMLFVADAAPAQGSPLCDNRRASSAMWYFCGHVDGAYGANLNVPESLRREPFRGTKEGAEYRKEVSMANQKISEILKKTTEEELLTAAKEALTAEVDVLSKVKVFCEGKGDSGEGCSDVLDDLSNAVEQMVLAVMELPKVKASSMGKTIETAHTKFNKEYFGEEDSDYADLAYHLGKAVLEAISA